MIRKNSEIIKIRIVGSFLMIATVGCSSLVDFIKDGTVGRTSLIINIVLLIVAIIGLNIMISVTVNKTTRPGKKQPAKTQRKHHRRAKRKVE